MIGSGNLLASFRHFRWRARFPVSDFVVGPPGVESDVVEPAADSTGVIGSVLICFSVDGAGVKTFRTFLRASVIHFIRSCTSVFLVLDYSVHR